MVKRERSTEPEEEAQKQPDSASKRIRQDEDLAKVKIEETKPAYGIDDAQFDDDDDEGDGRIHLPTSTSRATLKKGSECPYLDTVSRQVGPQFLTHVHGVWMRTDTQHDGLFLASQVCSLALCVQNLDFDFEKCCSVTLSHVNVYVCLVCGKYYQGRSISTQAYTHALETGHHMFMKLDSGKVGQGTNTSGAFSCELSAHQQRLLLRSHNPAHHAFCAACLSHVQVYCLPDNYEVVDRSLDDVRYVLNPRFAPTDVARLDKVGNNTTLSELECGSDSCQYFPAGSFSPLAPSAT